MKDIAIKKVYKIDIKMDYIKFTTRINFGFDYGKKLSPKKVMALLDTCDQST